MISEHFYFLGLLNTYPVFSFKICVALALINVILYFNYLIFAVRPVFQANSPKNTIKGVNVKSVASVRVSITNYG
jgi:hypothetical protein